MINNQFADIPSSSQGYGFERVDVEDFEAKPFCNPSWATEQVKHAKRL